MFFGLGAIENLLNKRIEYKDFKELSKKNSRIFYLINPLTFGHT